MMLLAQFAVILLILSFTALSCRSFVKCEEPFEQFHLEFSKTEYKYVFLFEIKGRNISQKKKEKKKAQANQPNKTQSLKFIQAKPTQAAAGSWNHRTAGIRKDLKRSPSPTPPLKQASYSRLHR